MSDFVEREKRKMQDQAEQEDEYEPPGAACKGNSPVVVLFPPLMGRDDKSEPGSKQEGWSAQAVEEFVELEVGRLLKDRPEKRSDDMSLQHQKDDGGPVQVDENESYTGSGESTGFYDPPGHRLRRRGHN